MPNYFTVGFWYPGPYANLPSDDPNDETNTNFNKAEDKVDAAAKSLGLAMRHEYGWPDGSLYKFVQTSMNEQELKDAFLKVGVQVSEIYPREPTYDPKKYGVKTLEGWFNGESVADQSPNG
jgi:hypothetical protein